MGWAFGVVILAVLGEVRPFCGSHGGPAERICAAAARAAAVFLWASFPVAYFFHTERMAVHESETTSTPPPAAGGAE